jgi:hypothetical protein
MCSIMALPGPTARAQPRPRDCYILPLTSSHKAPRLCICGSAPTEETFILRALAYIIQRHRLRKTGFSKTSLAQKALIL